ncbi:MAG: extracellular solute-binding protein [Clostridia bacterium]|nr:extracellular solute-binding protein [Clostridia bacterium]
MKKSVFSFLLVFLLILPSVFVPASAEDARGNEDLSTITLTVNDACVFEGVEKTDDGIKFTEQGRAVWKFGVSNGGEYTVDIYYKQDTQKYSKIVFSMLVDGNKPFTGADNLKLDHLWQYKSDKIYDVQGNEIRNDQIALENICKKRLTVKQDFEDKDVVLKLDAGQHAIEFLAIDDAFTVEKIVLSKKTEVLSYSDYLKANSTNVDSKEKKAIKLQAEEADAKSDKSILIQNDRSSVNVEPYHAIDIRYNCLGGDSWSMVGDFIEWEIDVKHAGFYNLDIRYKQNLKTNDISHRTLYIDGELPFKEAKNIEFKYDSGWNVLRIGEDKKEAFKFYLIKGKHTLRFTADSGDRTDLLIEANDILKRLNEDYLSILMITGADADVYRDYKFDLAIPETIADMKKLSKELKDLEKKCEKYNGGGASTAVFSLLYDTLDAMTEDTDKLAENISNLDSNITSLSTWIFDAQAQPVLMDYITLSPLNTEKPKAEGNFFEMLWHHLKQYILSFSYDYANVGNTKEKTKESITVWTFVSQEQTNIIQRLSTNSFVSEKNIPVNVQLINQTALLPAILADIGPDVALGLPQSTPVNYALRNAIIDLNQFSDVEEVKKNFADSAIVPFTLNDGLYALPETQSFNVLFYRKDVLEEMNIPLSKLDTWDSLLTEVMPELQLNHLTFGIPQGIQSYLMFLHQKDGKLYSDDHLSTLLDEAKGVSAFKDYVSLYKEYKLPLSFSFINRFRTGQMPIGIADFTTFNTLAVSAPEIDGLWGMLPIPGTVDENGNVNRKSSAIVTGCAILKEENKKEAWEFIKWWTSEETQFSFSQELEILLGSAARNATANVNAFNKLSWNKEMLKAINTQRNSTVGFEEIAGGYFTDRYFGFAFADVIYENKDIIETLGSAAKNINTEIEIKTEELLLNK